MAITLRPCQPEDESFLFTLYASTRQEELAVVDWSEAEKETFLRLQFTAQRQGYLTQSPQAVWQIILQDDRPIGRIIVERRTREIGLMDIALLPEYRNQGVGTRLIQGVMAEATQANLPVRLYVEKDNPGAMRLYQRLGFVVIGDVGMHFWLEWQPS